MDRTEGIAGGNHSVRLSRRLERRLLESRHESPDEGVPLVGGPQGVRYEIVTANLAPTHCRGGGANRPSCLVHHTITTRMRGFGCGEE